MWWLAKPVGLAAAAVVKSILDTATESEMRARQSWDAKWLAIPVGLAAAAVVKSILDTATESEIRARQSWDAKRVEVAQSVEDCRLHVEQHLYGAAASWDFHYLRDLHFSSFRVADTAYEMLKNAQVSIQSVQGMIDKTHAHRESIKAKLNDTPRGTERDALFQEMEQLKELRTSLIGDIKELRNQKSHLASEVKLFNSRTREIKTAIRDRCGDGGRKWYERLEARRSARS